MHSETLRKIAAEVPAGTKLAIVVGSTQQVCTILSQAGMKVFCIVPNADLKPFCLACGSLLYSHVFPITGDHRKVPSNFPVKVDMVFLASSNFSIQSWLTTVCPGGTLAGSNYHSGMSAMQVNHAHGMWWKCLPGGSERSKCAWEMMPDGGYHYLQTIATSTRINL